jgi:hypothetical protein
MLCAWFHVAEMAAQGSMGNWATIFAHASLFLFSKSHFQAQLGPVGQPPLHLFHQNTYHYKSFEKSLY